MGDKVLFVSDFLKSWAAVRWRGIAGKPEIKEMLILPWQQRTDNLSLGHCNLRDWWLWSCDPRLSVGVTNDMRDSRARQRITLIRPRLHTVSTQPDDIQTSIANIQRMLFVAHSDSCLIWKIENATVIFLISLCIISLILDKATNTNQWLFRFLSHSPMIGLYATQFVFVLVGASFPARAALWTDRVAETMDVG